MKCSSGIIWLNVLQVGSFLPCEAAYLQRPTADEADNENAFDDDNAEDATLTKLAAALPADVSRISTADLDAPAPAGKWLKERIGIDSTPVKSEHEYAVFFSLAPLCIISKSVAKRNLNGQEKRAKKKQFSTSTARNLLDCGTQGFFGAVMARATESSSRLQNISVRSQMRFSRMPTSPPHSVLARLSSRRCVTT